MDTDMGGLMPTSSKKEIVLAVVNKTGRPSAEASAVCQTFLDQIVEELAKGNRLEFRDFGVFELKRRKSRTALLPGLRPVRMLQTRGLRMTSPWGARTRPRRSWPYRPASDS